MAELLRPPPDEPWWQKARMALRGLSPGHVVGGLAALAVAALATWWLLRPPPPPVEDSLPLAPAAVPSATTATESRALVVQAAGAVARPGVYRLPEGSRVDDLLTMAGGATPDGDPHRINLAARLADGQRVYVPRLGEAFTAEPSSGAPTGPVDLNLASASQLEELPGVGPATAAAIVARRSALGRFRDIEDLLEVPGIGPAKLDALRGLVSVG